MNPNKSRSNAVAEWIGVAVIVLAVTLITASTQKPLTYHDGKGWDGVYYYAVASDFASGRTPAAEPPFVFRIATPFLAAKINPQDLMAGFRALDLAACGVTIVLFVLWLRIYLGDWRVRLMMVLLYATQFFGPLRSLHWYAVGSDSLTHLGIMSGLLLLSYLERSSIPVSVLCMTCFTVIAMPIRELMLLFPMALLFGKNPIVIDTATPWFVRLRRRPSMWLLLPLAAGALTLYFIRHSVTPLPSAYNAKREIMNMLYTKSLLTYLHGWFIAFGPVLALVVWKFRDSVAYLWRRQSQLILLLAIAGLGWIAGTDTERFLFWAFPIVYVLLGRVLEAHQWLARERLLLAVLALAQAISQRLFWPLPDYPISAERTWVVLTMWGSRFDVFNLWSWHAERFFGLASLLEHVALFAALVVWLRYRETRQLSTVRIAAVSAAAAPICPEVKLL